MSFMPRQALPTLDEAAGFSPAQVVQLALDRATLERDVGQLQQKIAGLEHQVDWFRRQIFGQKSEKRSVLAPAEQMSLGELLSLPQTGTPPDAPERSVAGHSRKRSPKAPDAKAESISFFDEARVPIEVIELASPDVAGLTPAQYEIIGTKESFRLAQRPGSYVVIKYVRPIVKRVGTPLISCPAAPVGVIEGSRADVSFVAGVPIVEKGLKDKFAKFREALCDLAFYNSEYDVYCRTIKEDWKQNTEGGSIDRTCFVHLYRFPEIALSQQKQLLKKVDKALDKKRSGRVVDRDDWNFVARFITERKEEHDGKEKKIWEKNLEALRSWERTAGCFVIRSDWLEDPIEALRIYRRRNIVEVAFRQFKVLNRGNRLYATQTSYMGKLMVHTIAQSLRMAITVQAKRRETQELKLPDNSVEKLLTVLKKVRAVRAPTRSTWVVEPLTKKAQDMLELLNLPKPPMTFKSI